EKAEADKGKTVEKTSQKADAKKSETKKSRGRSRLQDLMAQALENAVPEEEISAEKGMKPGVEPFAQKEKMATFTVTRRSYAQSTFETFVSGASNRTAFTTARGIFQRLGYVSPILFTGGTGTGKTHLLNAVYNHALTLGVSVVYRTCEDFLTDFVNGIRDPQKKAEFETLYRQCDILALDNLQALLGKPKTVAELRTILDYRIRLGKQIVLASDRDVKALAEFGPEICSQLEGGYVCHMSEPSYDVRLGILSRENGRRELALSDMQCQKLAFQYEGDVRAILGALNTLEMKVRAQLQFRPGGEKSVSVQERTAILQQLVEGMASQPGKTIRLEDIKRYVALLFGIDVPLLSSGKRERKVSQPRMLAMWLARKFTRKSLSEIGQAFGCNSHSTVISAQKKVEQWRMMDYRLQTHESVQNVNDLLYQLESQLQRAL
ncbi:MAG: DnaA/Hda family protein, partial [Planctomycetia bacterium]|nr:DnaA/Hda family protein [Planctomycetia bacterium]